MPIFIRMSNVIGTSSPLPVLVRPSLSYTGVQKLASFNNSWNWQVIHKFVLYSIIIVLVGKRGQDFHGQGEGSFVPHQSAIGIQSRGYEVQRGSIDGKE